jgi:hypothetical protein
VNADAGRVVGGTNEFDSGGFKYRNYLVQIVFSCFGNTYTLFVPYNRGCPDAGSFS